MKKRNAAITAKIKKMYDIEVTDKVVYIYGHAFINIYKDDEYRVERNKHTLDIMNSKVCVGLRLDGSRMHVTVY